MLCKDDNLDEQMKYMLRDFDAALHLVYLFYY